MFPLIALLAPSIGAAIGKLFGAGKQDKAEKLYQAALAQVMPEVIAETETRLVRPDAGGIAAQRAALAAFGRDAQSGGLGPEDKLNQAEAQDEAARFTRGQRGALDQLAMRRGTFDSGTQYAGQLMAQQGGADRANRAAMMAAAEASRRRRAALQMLGALGGQVRGQSSQEQASNRDALLGIKRFNAANMQATNMAKARMMAQEGDRLSGQAADAAAEGAQFGSGIGNAAAAYGQYGGGGNQNQSQYNYDDDGLITDNKYFDMYGG